MSKLDLKLGTDPEVFLELNGKIISAHGIIPGTKKEPYKLEKGAVQLDGVACEFNIDPARTANEFDNNISTVLTQVKEIIHKTDKDIKIRFSPIARFDPDYWKTLPEDVKILGCDPDFDRMGNVIQKDVEFLFKTPIRTAAGHIHIGFCEGEDVKSSSHFEDCRYLASYFASYNQPTGRYGLSPDEKERLKYYGGGAAFRPKPYGVELRQYSNLWVENSITRREAFNHIAAKVHNLFKG